MRSGPDPPDQAGAKTLAQGFTFYGKGFNSKGCLTQNAARMRVQRAMQRWREILSRKGVATSVSGLAALPTANTIAAAPAGLLAVATTATLRTGSLAHLEQSNHPVVRYLP